MSVLEDLADSLAKDTIEEAFRIGRESLITDVAKQLGATSTTMEEAYLTSIRMRLAERRAREFLTTQVKQADAKSG
ncbi:hypothetical protein [Tropicimonas sediminicola]|uniref:Uncharacterized protein n=1 Tax=Tropicimonas sediminicola TaxID=1031541 RepID=A0A239H0L5_9RHOB|nr:hypothetical protein [Tropicimonas sediminicola]SNS74665.1 hypothetical protein SAMN05421757_103184 [Tropicimonas sediminicola]